MEFYSFPFGFRNSRPALFSAFLAAAVLDGFFFNLARLAFFGLVGLVGPYLARLFSFDQLSFGIAISYTVVGR